jgi:hypothetical protein
MATKTRGKNGDISASFMKFCPVVPEICRGHVHVAKKERRRIIMIIIIIIIRNGAKTISLQTTFISVMILQYFCL